MPAGGRSLQPVTQVTGEPRGYQQLTVSTSAVALTVPKNANSCTIIVEDYSIRWRDDSVDPTNAVGMPVWPGNVIQLQTAKQLAQFRAIRDVDAEGDAILNISYYETAR